MSIFLLLFLLVFSSPAWAATITETWTSANADDIDGDQTWDDDPFTGSGDLRLQNNRVDGETNGLAQDDPRLQTDLGTATQTVTALVTVAQPSSGTNLMGAALRMNAATTETYCGCALIVTSAGAESLRCAKLDAGVLTSLSVPAVTYTAGNAATVQAEMTAGSTTLTCTYDPGGANEQGCTGTCDVAETNFVGIYANQNSGPAGSISIDNYVVTTPSAGRRRTAFPLP